MRKSRCFITFYFYVLSRDYPQALPLQFNLIVINGGTDGFFGARSLILSPSKKSISWPSVFSEARVEELVRLDLYASNACPVFMPVVLLADLFATSRRKK